MSIGSMKTLFVLHGRLSRWQGGLGWSASQLPADFLARSRERLGTVAAFVAAVELLILGGLLYGPVPEQFVPRALELNETAIALQAGASLLVAVLVFTQTLPDRYVLIVGLVYQVFVCWLLSVGMTRASMIVFGHVPLVTWTEPIILIFPLLVPTTPWRTFLTALLSALTRPAALLFLASHGEMQWATADLLLATASPAMALVFALFGARIVYGFGREVATAREMGAYRLQTRLGSGGMGEVWSASHRMLARPAAVKLIRPEVLGAAGSNANAAVERFEREAQVTANLRSGHTVDLYDFGRAEDGAFYYVMELLDGFDLETLVTKYGPVPVERAVHLTSQICHSLDEAHASGLVHRDIKPANVFTCRHGRDLDFVKVLDFGLVKATPRTEFPDTKLTAGDAVIGTPAFLAPEMATGGKVDHRADIYAVGCILYWLVSGRLVFDAESAMALAVAHATSTPTPLSEVSEASIPAELDTLVLRCLAKDPDERPPTAGDLACDLAGVPLEQPWTPERAARWWRLHSPKTALAI